MEANIEISFYSILWCLFWSHLMCGMLEECVFRHLNVIDRIIKKNLKLKSLSALNNKWKNKPHKQYQISSNFSLSERIINTKNKCAISFSTHLSSIFFFIDGANKPHLIFLLYLRQKENDSNNNKSINLTFSPQLRRNIHETFSVQCCCTTAEMLSAVQNQVQNHQPKVSDRFFITTIL